VLSSPLQNDQQQQPLKVLSPAASVEDKKSLGTRLRDTKIFLEKNSFTENFNYKIN
jgi:hypothetical protein